MSLSNLKRRWNNIPIWYCYALVFILGIVIGATFK